MTYNVFGGTLNLAQLNSRPISVVISRGSGGSCLSRCHWGARSHIAAVVIDQLMNLVIKFKLQSILHCILNLHPFFCWVC